MKGGDWESKKLDGFQAQIAWCWWVRGCRRLARSGQAAIAAFFAMKEFGDEN
jgi:hypothetical protein